MKTNPNLTITLPTGYLDAKPLDKVTTYNTRVGEFEAELRQLAIDATGQDIDPMAVEVSELEQFQHVMRRRRLELGRRGLALVEQREALVDDLLDENTKAIAKAEQGLAKATKKTIEALQSAGIGPRPGATPNAARIQMTHKANESAQVAASRNRLATAKTAQDLLHTAARSDEQLRDHYRSEVELVIAMYGVL
jgi:hypothetical protein